MVVHTKPLTVEAFDEWVALPEQADQRWEFIAEEIYAEPSNPYASMIAGLIIAALDIYLKSKPIGYVTRKGGSYMVSGQRFAPDVAYINRGSSLNWRTKAITPPRRILPLKLFQTPPMLRSGPNCAVKSWHIWRQVWWYGWWMPKRVPSKSTRLVKRR